jgi:hypothetical protein
VLSSLHLNAPLTLGVIWNAFSTEARSIGLSNEILIGASVPCSSPRAGARSITKGGSLATSSWIAFSG